MIILNNKDYKMFSESLERNGFNLTNCIYCLIDTHFFRIAACPIYITALQELRWTQRRLSYEYSLYNNNMLITNTYIYIPYRHNIIMLYALRFETSIN